MKLHENFAQKLLAVSLFAAAVLMGVPLGGQSVHVADAIGNTTLPETIFLFKEDLLEVCANTNDG